MKKQIIITSAMLTSLVLLLTCNAWAEPERRRGRGGDQHWRDDGRRPERTAKPDRGRQWQGRKGHRDPSGHWKPKGRHHVRRHDDRRWHRRKPHPAPRHRWHHRRHHWRPGRHRPFHFYRRPVQPRRGHTHRHAWRPVVDQHRYHRADHSVGEPASAEHFGIAAHVS